MGDCYAKVGPSRTGRPQIARPGLDVLCVWTPLSQACRFAMFGAFNQEPHEREQEADDPETRDPCCEDDASQADQVVPRDKRNEGPPNEPCPASGAQQQKTQEPGVDPEHQ